MLDASVEPDSSGADAADDFLGEAGRLPFDRVDDRGARGDLPERALGFLAGEHPVGELEGSRARERSAQESLELSTRRQLRHHALEHPMPGDRARDLLRQGAGERTIDDPCELRRREHLVRHRLELIAPDARGRARRKERSTSGCVCQAWSMLVRRRHL
jgi:hypothetical protein